MARKPVKPSPGAEKPAIVMPAPVFASPTLAVVPIATKAEAPALPVKKPLLASSSLTSAATDEPVPAPLAEIVPPVAEAAVESTAAVVETMEAATSPATASDVNPVAAPPAQQNQGPAEMATFVPPAAETAEKTQAMLGDVQNRMKSAFDRSSKIGEDMVEMSKGNVEAMMASARIAAKATETLGQEAADYSRKSFEHATAMFKSFATVKSPTEMFQLQSEFAKASFDNAVAEASKMSETMVKLAGEIAQPLSNRYAMAAEKMKASIA